MFTRAIRSPFVGHQLDCRQSQTQIDNVFTRPTLSDRATSSDLDIRWRELTDTVVTISKIKKVRRVHLLGAEWLPRKERCHLLENLEQVPLQPTASAVSFAVGRCRQSQCRATNG